MCLLHTLTYTTDTDRSASYLDLHLEIDSEGRLRRTLYNKRNDFNLLIVNFPFICSNIPAAPAYGVYIFQLIRYSRACGSYQGFLDSGLLLTIFIVIWNSKAWQSYTYNEIDCVYQIPTYCQISKSKSYSYLIKQLQYFI